MHSIQEDLMWRYATKKFDSSKKISDSDINTIKQSLRLVPTSYGLQPLEYIIVESEELRNQLVEASHGQLQVKDASHLIVICSYKRISDEIIDNYIKLTAKEREQTFPSLKGFGDFIKSTLNNWSDDEITTWATKQAYIALGQLLHTCATLRVDATPMEGFIAEQYNSILQLDDNLTATLICPIGYRHDEDQNQHLKKVRKSMDDLFTIK